MPKQPPQLFKYMSRHRTSFFESPELLFRHPEQFNDYYDCEPHIKGVYRLNFMQNLLCGSVMAIRANAPGIDSYLYDISENVCKKFDEELGVEFRKRYKDPEQLGKDIINFLNTPRGRQEFQGIDKHEELPKIIEKINAQFKNKFLAVFCLTEDVKNLLMWAHYSSDNSGFAIEINTKDEIFHLIDGRPLPIGFLKKVSYKSINNATYFTDYLTPQGDLQHVDLLRDAVFTKQPRWSYEKEWRIALIANGLPHITHIMPCDDGLRVSVLPSIVKGVYLGIRATDNVRGSATQFCNKHGIPLFQMVRTPDQAFTAEPVALGI